VGTNYQSWLKKIIDDALKHRNTKLEDEEKGEFVVLEEKFFKDLQQTNFISSKNLNFITYCRETWKRSVLLTEEDC
jgi:hypothetical protein